MKKYVEIENGIIVGCGEIDIDELPSHYTEIEDELYGKITNLPADFSVDTDGEIVEIMPHSIPPEIPKPPTETEILRQTVADLESQNTDLMLAIAEMAEATEQSKTETQIAIAELAEIIAGGA